MSNSRQHSIQSFLLTGASGFLGRIIKAILSEKNQLITLGRQAGNDIQCDLSITIPEITAPLDCVIHAAGKAHVVPKNAKEAQAFFEVNEQGTLNLLKGLEKLDHLPSRFIFISSVAVYGLSEGTGVEESHPLNGRTPYARSKINAERLIGKWCRANGVNCIILRLPLVAGKNAPGNLGALTKAIERGMYFSISDNAARKSMVLASDVAYLVASVKDASGIYNLTDDQDPLFVDVEKSVAKGLGRSIRITIPLWMVSILARTGDFLNRLNIPVPLNSERLKKVTSTLTFSCRKAKEKLGWRPNAVLSYLRSNFKKPVV